MNVSHINQLTNEEGLFIFIKSCKIKKKLFVCTNNIQHRLVLQTNSPYIFRRRPELELTYQYVPNTIYMYVYAYTI